MVGWVSPEIKTELMKLSNSKLQIICADNYEDFTKDITDDSHLSISLTIAKNNLEFLRSLLKKYSNQKFHIIFDQKHFSNEVLELFTECDKRCNHYSLELLIEDFKKRCKSSTQPSPPPKAKQ
jgi:c-di-AMP phosphodiesterase-like protein